MRKKEESFKSSVSAKSQTAVSIGGLFGRLYIHKFFLCNSILLGVELLNMFYDEGA